MQHFIEGWYVIYTRARHERKVASALLERNIEAFWPKVKQFRVWHDRKKFIDSPLFPSYVFVYIKSTEEYHSAIRLEGVVYFVKAGRTITRVSEQIISNLLLLDGRMNEIEITADSFQQGQWVSVQDGPLKGINGEVIQRNGKEKLLVRVDLLQRNVLLSIHPNYLRKVPIVSGSAEPGV